MYGSKFFIFVLTLLDHEDSSKFLDDRKRSQLEMPRAIRRKLR